MNRKRDKDKPESQPSTPPAPEEVQPPIGPEGRPEAEAGQGTESSAVPVEALTEERDDLLARLQRVSADYLNYQKRAQRDLDAAREYANESLMRALLAVLDDMERALAAAREGRDENDPLLAGMQMVHDKATETLGRFGLSVIEAEGKPFDPEHHAAMMQQPSEKHPPQTVLTELVKGYQLKGRTIRPAGVIVSSEPGADDEDD